VCTKQDQEKEQGIELYRFRIHLVITISAVVSGRLGPCQEWKFFFIKHKLYVNG